MSAGNDRVLGRAVSRRAATRADTRGAGRGRLAVAVVLAALLALAGGVAPLHRPVLRVEASVAGDLEALARATWDRFLEAFSGTAGCLGDVSLRAASQLDSRAAYDPATAVVTVRVPGTAAMLQSALIHEWAHHVEFQCPAPVAFQSRFVAAQGLPPGTAWRPEAAPADVPASLWADIPAEQFAEAAIEVVLGSRPIPTNVQLRRETVRLVASWARGEGEW